MKSVRAVLLLLTLGLLGVGPAVARPSHPNWPPKRYAIYYGPFNEEQVRQAWQFNLIVVHPGDDSANLNPELVERLRRGADGQAGTPDDVIVLGYVTIGEDDQVPAGPPGPELKGDGPVFRDAAGKLQASRKGYPTRYLDQVAYQSDGHGFVRFGPDGKPVVAPGQDGVPDENGVWGSYYAYAGDPQWREILMGRFQKLVDLGVDGFFLDTLDTASPWGNYGFTQPQMVQLLQAIRKRFPNQFIMGNRGMFLLDKYADGFKHSLDGLLFESFLTEWNWYLKEGFPSPWLAGNVDVLKQQVVPSGLTLFLIDYVSREQKDLYNLLHAELDMTAGVAYRNYLAGPLLDSLYPPIDELFPVTSSTPMPSLAQFQVEPGGQGHYRVSFLVQNLGGRRLGQDLFLDLRACAGEVPEAQLATRPYLPIDYANLQTTTESGGTRVSFESYGLDRGQPYSLYLRLLGPAQSDRTPYARASASLGVPAYPGLVTDLQAAAGDGQAALSWKDPNLGSKGYRIYRGTSPFDVKPIGDAAQSPYTVGGLPNGQAAWLAVAALDAQGREGCLSRPVLVTPVDATPPDPPASLSARVEGSQLKVEWSATAGADGYRLYCIPQGQLYRIPLRLDAQTTSHSLTSVAPGRYRVFVTAVDGDGNQSRPSPMQEVTLK